MAWSFHFALIWLFLFGSLWLIYTDSNNGNEFSEKGKRASALDGVIVGNIIYEEYCVSEKECNDVVLSTVSSVDNEDGSVTMFQYLNGTLTDSHTTIPGSGVVYHEYYENEKVIQNELEDVRLSQAIYETSVAATSPIVTNRTMGYMYYHHSITNTTYSILTTLTDLYYQNTTYTFNQGTAKNLANWTASILSLWAFGTNPASAVSKAIGFFSVTGILEKGANGVYTALITRTVTCNYNNQTFYGNATSPSTNYPQGVLSGTYAVVNNNGQTKTITEGYTVRMWGTAGFGRMMMYNVFGMDVSPTSWTGV